MSLIKNTENLILKAVNELGYEIDNVTLEKSTMKNLGQYQVNFAMGLAKKYSKNPRDIATEIMNAIKNDFNDVNIAGPGFINITFKDEDLINNAVGDFSNHIDYEKPKKIKCKFIDSIHWNN